MAVRAVGGGEAVCLPAPDSVQRHLSPAPAPGGPGRPSAGRQHSQTRYPSTYSSCKFTVKSFLFVGHLISCILWIGQSLNLISQKLFIHFSNI